MTLLKRMLPVLLVLLVVNGSLFGFRPDDKYVDIQTANTEVNDRQAEVQTLRAEVTALVKDTTETEAYLDDRNNKLIRVRDAMDKMNGSIADILKIMSEMNDSKARLKFQDSIKNSRDTRDNLIISERTLTRQIAEAEERLVSNREKEFIALSKIDRLEGEIITLREQIARTEEQERRLDATIKLANDALNDVNRLVGDIGDI